MVPRPTVRSGRLRKKETSGDFKGVRLRHLINSARILANLLAFAVVSDRVIAQAAPTLEAKASEPVPARPDEPRAAKAYAVLETYCARCHQAGRLEQSIASGGLANILAIDDQARDRVLVKPGLPDASRLYDVLETRHAPLDVFTGEPGKAEPQPDDIAAVRRWIKDLAPAVQSCPSRHPVRPAEVDKLLRDAQRLERDQGKDVRFISLVHLYNSCATPGEMTAYGQALNKLMNSLSWSAEPVKLTPLDEAGTLFSFRLADFGWDDARWKPIEKAYPQDLVHTVAPDVVKTANSSAVVVNGDWLAAAAGETPLYYALLGLPAKLPELAKMNGTDLDANIRAGSVRRIAIRESAVTRGNRVIERHPGKTAGLWLAYDFATSTGEQNVFEHPQGPKSATTAKSPFRPDQIRVLLVLPNGFYAFALFDADGNRIDRALPGIEKPYAGVEANAVEPATTAGTNCFACHMQGLVQAKDDFRAAGPIDISAGPMTPDRRAVLPLFGTDSENALLMLGGWDRYRAAAKAAGVDLDMRVHGDELVTGLARRYREGADFEVALGETGLERQDFLKELADAKGAAAPLARRLLQGVLSRNELEHLFSILKGTDAPSQTTPSAGFLREVKSAIGLTMWFDKPRPVPGDIVTIKAEADTKCYLTVISVDSAGVATVLFPSDFQQDNLLTAGEPVSIPSPDAPFQLRYKAEGSETILGRCGTSATPPVGIEHDFERQRFTVLGNWENFLQDTLVTDWEMRTSPEKAERARIARTGAIRRQQDRGERIPAPRADVASDKSLRDGRAILVLGRS
jgi:mono/diheme cytochrome c family protein